MQFCQNLFLGSKTNEQKASIGSSGKPSSESTWSKTIQFYEACMCRHYPNGPEADSGQRGPWS